MRTKLIFGIALFYLIDTSIGSYPIALVTPDNCNNDEYFDPICASCKRCGSTSKCMQQDGHQEDLQQTATDGSSCFCKPQYYLKERKSPHDIVCSRCTDNKVPSLDGLKCVSCADDYPFNSTTGLCEPCSSGFVVENGTQQLCIRCENRTVFEGRLSGCKTCSGNHVADDNRCSCPSNLTVSGGHCLPLYRSKPSLFTVEFENDVKVRSSFFVEHFNAAYYNCKEYSNNTACQVLANMCVMLLYKLDSFSAEDNACLEFWALMKDRSYDCQCSGKSFGLWLYYNDKDAKAEVFKPNVPNVYSSNPALDSSKLHLIAMKHDINGKFLGMSKIKSHNLLLCQSSNSGEDIALTFGTRIEEKCKISVRELWDSSKLLFYDLFLASDINSNKSKMYPVPVLIKTVRKNGELINKGNDVSKWQLVRRFFLTDGISGIEAGTSIREKHNQPVTKVFRYASDISLKITLKTGDTPGSIFPPLLIISYSELTPDDYLRNKKVVMTLSVSYEMDQSEIKYGIGVAVGVLSALAFLWSVLQTWSWFRRAGKYAVDILTLGKFVIFMCGNLANVLFIVAFCASLNWFSLFKKQDVVHLLLPTHEQEKFLSVYLGIAFAMKAMQVIHMLAVQCTIDIFFVDWERPRIRRPSIPNRAASAIDSKTVSESGAGSGSKVLSTTGKTTPEKVNLEMAGVSIWRTYFVANEWAEIQSMRKISLSLQLFGTLFFLKVVDFESFTLAAPLLVLSAPEIKENVPYSICCRFALGASIYLIIGLVQVAFRKGIYERFVEDKLQQYVDLCSVSNVSVFILATKRFGYYIHGRSAHGKADVNMKEMHELLRREEEDLCGHRGLLPNTEQQTFQMGLPSGVFDQFKRLLLPLTTYSQAADRMQGVGGRLSKVDIDRVVHTYHTINKFLSGFIEHAFKDLDYIVKDKVMLENLLDIECYETDDRGYFYNDDGHSFDSVLLFGNEATLMIFDVLLFSIVDITSSDYVLSAVITFLVEKVIQALRQTAGRRNLVRKALIDERFLT